MEVIVLRRFLDKHTGEVRKPGDVLEITEERFEEIMKTGKLVEKISEEASKTKEDIDKVAEPKKSNKKTNK